MRTWNPGGGPDPALLGLTVSRRFQDLSPNAKSIHILRSDEFGLTIYANVRGADGTELSRHRGRYMIAYEGETATREQVQQVIVETDHAHKIYRFLELVESHVDRISQELRLLAAGRNCSGGKPLADWSPTDIDAVSGFDSPEVRASVESALTELGCRPPEGEAYLGFQNVVLSKVDDWLARQTGELA